MDSGHLDEYHDLVNAVVEASWPTVKGDDNYTYAHTHTHCLREQCQSKGDQWSESTWPDKWPGDN